jgi:hypothetical protein
LGLADLPIPSAGSGRPKKRQRPGFRCCTAAPTHGRSLAAVAHSGNQSSGRRDWANLTSGLVDEIAARLLSFSVSEYIRFRTVCRPWRELTDDPRARGGLDPRFRPRGWFPLCKNHSRWRMCNPFKKARARLNLQIFATSHLLSVADGLLVMCDKATNVVRLLHPFASAFAEFPVITDVRSDDGARLAMDGFKARFSGADSCELGFPAMNAVIDIAYIDDSTTPPTLQLFVNNGPWIVICAKPGDGLKKKKPER